VPSQFAFDLEQDTVREEMAAYITSHGLSKIDAAEVISLSLKIAAAVVSSSRYEKVSPQNKNQLPKLIINVLGPKFSDAERQTLRTNYPESGNIVPENYWDPQVRDVMVKFANELGLVITRWINEISRDSRVDTGTIVHYLVPSAGDIEQEGFEKFLAYLDSVKGIGIERYPNDLTRASVFYDTSDFKTEVALVDLVPTEVQQKKGVSQRRVKITSQQIDNITINLLKDLGRSLGYRVFSNNLGIYLPSDPSLFDIYNGFVRPEVVQLVKDRGFTLLFTFRNGLTCYAKKNDSNEMHIINGYLLEYLVNNPATAVSPEFSYKVAETLDDFSMRYEVGLIPISFYKYYGKSQKITNWGDFDIDTIDRKVFIKPYVFELNSVKQGFYAVAGPDGHAIGMTKVSKGQTVEQAVRDFLKNELNIAQDFIGATVEGIMEFDFDKENNLTPRIIMKVFIGEGVITQEQRERLQKGWITKPQQTAQSQVSAKGSEQT